MCVFVCVCELDVLDFLRETEATLCFNYIVTTLLHIRSIITLKVKCLKSVCIFIKCYFAALESCRVSTLNNALV